MDRQDIQSWLKKLAAVRTQNMPAGSDSTYRGWIKREAEVLCDPGLVEQIAEFLERERTVGYRKDGYLILGKLGRSTRIVDCATVLLTASKKEPGRLALIYLLSALRDIEIPKDADLGGVFRLVQDKRAIIRNSAIRVLRNAASPAVENHVLEALQSASSRSTVIECHRTLGRVGSERVIPFMEKNLKSRSPDVKNTAAFAIKSIRMRLGQAGLVSVGEYAQ